MNETFFGQFQTCFLSCFAFQFHFQRLQRLQKGSLNWYIHISRDSFLQKFAKEKEKFSLRVPTDSVRIIKNAAGLSLTCPKCRELLLQKLGLPTFCVSIGIKPTSGLNRESRLR